MPGQAIPTRSPSGSTTSRSHERRLPDHRVSLFVRSAARVPLAAQEASPVEAERPTVAVPGVGRAALGHPLALTRGHPEGSYGRDGSAHAGGQARTTAWARRSEGFQVGAEVLGTQSRADLLGRDAIGARGVARNHDRLPCRLIAAQQRGDGFAPLRGHGRRALLAPGPVREPARVGVPQQHLLEHVVHPGSARSSCSGLRLVGRQQLTHQGVGPTLSRQLSSPVRQASRIR